MSGLELISIYPIWTNQILYFNILKFKAEPALPALLHFSIVFQKVFRVVARLLFQAQS